MHFFLTGLCNNRGSVWFVCQKGWFLS